MTCFWIFFHQWTKWELQFQRNIYDIDYPNGRPIDSQEVYKRTCTHCGLVQSRRVRV